MALTLGAAVVVGAEALGGFAGGCVDTDLAEPPPAVFALFDPSTTPPTIPLPNDITMTAAQPDSVAHSSFSGPVDRSTLRAGTVMVIDATTSAPLIMASFALDEMATTLDVSPPTGGWPVGHRIAVVVRGSPGGLVGAKGEPVVASPAFYLVRSTSPLVQCPATGPCVSTTPLLTAQQAFVLEQLRVALAPLLDSVQALGVPRSEIVLAWTFTVGPPVGATDAGALPRG